MTGPVQATFADSYLFLYITTFLDTRTLGRLEQVSRAARSSAASAWSPHATQLFAFSSPISVIGKEASKRFVRCRQLARLWGHEAARHYRRNNDIIAHTGDMDLGQGGVTCDGNCTFPKFLDVGGPFEDVDAHDYFLWMHSIGEECELPFVSFQGFVTAEKVTTSVRGIPGDNPFHFVRNAKAALLLHRPERFQENSAVVDFFLGPERNDQFVLVLVAADKLYGTPRLVTSLVSYNSCDYQEEGDNRWQCLANQAVSTHNTTRRLGEVNGSIAFVVGTWKDVLIEHSILTVAFDHMNYPDEWLEYQRRWQR